MNGLIHRHILFGSFLNRSNIVMMIGMLLCVYFSYHLMHGNRSVTRLVMLQNQIEAQSVVQQDLAQRQTALEAKVKMMRPGSVDKDLLEERIQTVLGYTTQDDMIIPVQ